MDSHIHEQDIERSKAGVQPKASLNAHLNKGPSFDGSAEDHIKVPEYEASLQTGHVVFDQLVIARHGLCLHARHLENEEKVRHDRVRWTYAYYLPKLWQLYEKAEGKIIDYYFCYQTLAGVILSKKGDLVLRYLPQDVAHVTPGFESTLWKCTVQARLAKQLLLRWGGRRILLRRLFSVTVYLLTVLDSQARSRHGGQLEEREADRIQKALDNANNELKDTKDELRRLASRDTQWLYLLGMVPGILLLSLVAVWLATTETTLDEDPMLVALVAGGLGAIVSVMNRASSGKLELDYQAGWLLTTVSGFFRPVLGAVFGLAAYVFLNAGLLQITGLPGSQATGSEEDARIFFFAAIAFLAGFSERWAKDVLSLSTPNSGEADDVHTENLDHSAFHIPQDVSTSVRKATEL